MTSAVSSRAASRSAPSDRIAPVVPNDAADLPFGLTRALYVGVEGAVTVVDRFGGEATILSNAGQYHPLQVVRVKAEGTTAESILALY